MGVSNAISFSLQDVVTDLGGGETSLQECFNNAQASGFDPTYNQDSYAPANSLLRFRNYTQYLPMIITYNVTSNDTVSIPMFEYGTYDFSVDWGDGSALSFITAHDDVANTHAYTNAGSYNITILGHFSAFRFSTNVAAHPMAEKLTAIVDWGYSGLIYFAFAFARCSNLTSIPQKTIPCVPTTAFVNAMFYQTGITSITADIFDNILTPSTFNQTFQGCTALTGVAPSLWLTHTSMSSHSYTFRDCTGLSNYADIPSSWK